MKVESEGCWILRVKGWSMLESFLEPFVRLDLEREE